MVRPSACKFIVDRTLANNLRSANPPASQLLRFKRTLAKVAIPLQSPCLRLCEAVFVQVQCSCLLTTLCVVRSPMAQAYLEYLVALHPALAGSFSRILSAGIAASKPGIPLSPGVEFMLRDYGISPKFSHTSRRLERRDVEKFEYVLTMSCSQRDTILSRWPPRSQLVAQDPANVGQLCREDLEERVAVLGSFGGQGDREVSIAESINQVYWFHVGYKTHLSWL